MKNKRLKLTVVTFVVNAILLYVGIKMKADMTGFAIAIAAVDVPILGYLGSETVRPSGLKHKDHVKHD